MEEEPKRGTEAIYRSRGQMIANNLLGGMAWGVGTVIGASVIVTILAFFLHRINFVPGIGSFVAQIIDVVNQYNQSSPFRQ